MFFVILCPCHATKRILVYQYYYHPTSRPPGSKFDQNCVLSEIQSKLIRMCHLSHLYVCTYIYIYIYSSIIARVFIIHFFSLFEFRFDQLQYLPPPQPQIIQMQHSPSHHPNKGLPVYHPPSGPPKPIMWNGGTPVGPCYDAYALQNTAIFHHPSVPRPRTQFQLRDTPFIPLQVSFSK